METVLVVIFVLIAIVSAISLVVCLVKKQYFNASAFFVLVLYIMTIIDYIASRS